MRFAVRGRAEARRVVDQTGCAGHRGFLFEEKRKLEFEVGSFAVQARDERREEVADILGMQHGSVLLEHLEKTAHVRTLEFLGKLHGQLDGGNRALRFSRAHGHLDGEPQVFHPDLVDDDAPVVALALRVAQGAGALVGMLHG